MVRLVTACFPGRKIPEIESQRVRALTLDGVGSKAGDLTVILTLKDRSEFTRRWLKYMNDLECPYPILIGDGGTDLAIQTHLEAPDNYPNLNYEYVRFPPDTSFNDYYQKLVILSSRVATRYVVLADNDDFYRIASFDSYIRFLDAYHEYIGIRGSVVNFWLRDKESAVLNRPVAADYSAISLASMSLEEDSFSERAETFLSGIEKLNHFMNWYCIFRSDALRKTLATLDQHLPMDEFVYELMFSVLMIQQGKIRVEKEETHFRQHGTSTGLASLAGSGTSTLERMFINEGFRSIYDICKASNTFATEEARVKLFRAFARMIANHCLVYYSPPGYIKKLKAMLNNHPALYVNVYRLYELLRTSVGSKKFRRIPEIEKYILAR
jgi:glycosyltransferase domain-containing protein